MRLFFVILTALGFIGFSVLSQAQTIPQGWGLRSKHSLPPLGSDEELLDAQILHVATTDTAQQAQQKAPAQPTEVIPAEDTPSLSDEVDDTEAEAAVEPHVEEDSAGGLVDMGDVGGDFEE